MNQAEGTVCLDMSTAHNMDALPAIGYAKVMLPDKCVRQQKTNTETPTPAPTKTEVNDCNTLNEDECEVHEQTDGQHCKWGTQACEDTAKCGTVCGMMSGCADDAEVI